MADDLTFGQWIRRSRKGADLTQPALAAQISCALGTIRKLEADELRPSKELAARLAAYFGVPAAERPAFVAYARGQGDRPSLPARELAPHAPSAVVPASEDHPLPVPLTPLIGRTCEVETVGALLRRPDIRLVTLSGPGGAGKTRLALAVAATLRDHFADGVVLVELAALRDPARMLTTIGQTLGVKEVGNQPLRERLQTYLRAKQLLIVLDNCEHLAAAAPAITALLAGAPRLTVLATSRAVLHLSGEHEVPVLPLAQPDAITLFAARAQAARSDFAPSAHDAAAVAAICQRVDGLPLAIELAAARIKLFPPSVLLQRLADSLSFLTGGPRDVPARQQTMRNTIDWSYQLLDDADRVLFRRLAVFLGGWTLDAAEGICTGHGDDPIDVVYGIGQLLDQSLVRQEGSVAGEARFSMPEIIREYALERLAESGEADAMRQRHAAGLLTQVERREPPDGGGDLGAWHGWVGVEYGNLRAALQWAVEQPDVTVAVRLASALGDYWWAHGARSEARAYFDALLQLTTERPATPDDTPGWRVLRWHVLDEATLMAWARGDFAQAQQYADELLVLAYEAENVAEIAYALGSQGILALWHGEDRRAAALLTESVALARTVERSVHLAWMLINLGEGAWHAGNYAQAAEVITEALAVAREFGNQTFVAWALRQLGTVACLRGDRTEATDLLSTSLVIYRDTEDWWGVTECLESMVWVAGHQEVQTPTTDSRATLTRAARLLGAAATLRATTGHPPIVGCQVIHDRNAAAVRAAMGDTAFAAAWAEGGAMTLEQAVAYALEGVEQDTVSNEHDAGQEHLDPVGRASDNTR